MLKLGVRKEKKRKWHSDRKNEGNRERSCGGGSGSGNISSEVERFMAADEAENVTFVIYCLYRTSIKFLQ